MRALIKTLKKTFPIDKFFFHRSYSQEGEDMIYRSCFENRKNYKGFYIDVGAHHPYRFSNTIHFYQNGWKGINIEPTPGAIKLFKIFRRRDINLNIGIDTTAGILPFYCFNEPALNSFDKDISTARSATNTKYKITNVINVKTMPLGEVLATHLPEGQTIDFLNIDAEGFDLEVLKSNNWEKYIPLFIIVEVGIDIQNLADSELYNYLLARNYEMVAKTNRTSFFKLKPVS
ncbi:FkbM family methyltransferase [Pedobacter cryoconitis]|uniref:FkbM family methyltransferase n=1 Tax=Pedobacter cryoconitis TaxID=188932 RepID=UPI001616AD76|nr:FkbM family methyltransferase [Pedobacter cryoconitis]MBB6270100.1 FkbM family methyltransferase [Pedobacter cryoconitis]